MPEPDGRRCAGTFDLIEEHIPITRTEVPSGTRVFDWIVPDEWNIRDAYVAAPDGTRVVDFRDSTLHVVSYSEPVRATLSLDELRERLFTLPDQPDLIPYRTSYYARTWGFCLPHRRLLELEPGDYEVSIDSTLEPGHLTFAELLLEGETDDEVLISTYVCHPSLANDNLSGIVVATALAKELARRRLRHSYRFLFAPGDHRPAGVAAREPRSAGPGRARSRRLLHRRRRRSDVQAQPAGRRRRRSRRGDRAARFRQAAPRARVGALGRRRASVLRSRLRPPDGDADADAARRVRRLPHVGRRARADPPSALADAVGRAWRSSTCSRPTAPTPTSAPTVSRSSGAAASIARPVARSPRPTTSAACCGCSTRATAARASSTSPIARGCAYPVIRRAAERLAEAGLLAPAHDPAMADLARR